MNYGKPLNQQNFNNWEDRWKASWKPRAGQQDGLHDMSGGIMEDTSPTLGGVPIWRLQEKFGQGMRSNSGILADPQPVPGMLSKMGSWMGGHPMDAAKIAMNLWGAYNQNQAMGQQQQYMDQVEKAMLFDQKDVNRKWKLGMGDYRVREEDQNQHRKAQGMENKKTNFTV